MGKLLFDKPENYRIQIDYHDFSTELEDLFFTVHGRPLEEISFSSVDFFHDIITCGMPEFYITDFNHIIKRSDEINFKLYLIRMALEVDDNEYLIVSDRFQYLDSSEKRFVSYYIGMFITKLVSRKIFNYEYLVHLGIAKQYKKIIRDEKAPDLIGFHKRSDEYSIFEAKGRIKLKASLPKTAKLQIQSIKYISGSKPYLGVVCITHPIKEKNQLICSMYDPQPNQNGTLPIDIDDLLYLYYLPIFELIKENGTDEAHCELYFNDNTPNQKHCFIKMPQNLFDFFKKVPNFSIWQQSNDRPQLLEIISEVSDNVQGDLLSIQLN